MLLVWNGSTKMTTTHNWSLTAHSVDSVKRARNICCEIYFDNMSVRVFWLTVYLCREETTESVSVTSCVLASCVHVCRSLPQCNSTSCRANVQVLVRQLPTGCCDVGERRKRSSWATETLARWRRRRKLRSSGVDDESLRHRMTSKRGYSDATDICLTYNCGAKGDRTVYDYIQCAIESQCGLVWWNVSRTKSEEIDLF